MSWTRVIDRLERGEEVELHPKGNSMTPRIKSGERVVLKYWSTDSPRSFPLEVGMIVLAKVKGRYYLHEISRVEGRYPDIVRVEISNHHGHVNGWTPVSKVFGFVSKIGE